MPQRTEHRRHQALAKYLADDKVENICRHLACSKSWLYKWRSRYDATKVTWAQERSTRPKSHPTQTPAHVEQAVVCLHQTLRRNGTGGAAAIMQALVQQGIEPLPSRRTIYRILRRYHTEVKAHGARASRPV
jgi:transposase-like protein